MAALRFLAVGGIDADLSRLAVAGDSAGGLLATVLARRARDEQIPLCLQVVLYPNTDLREDGPHAGVAVIFQRLPGMVHGLLQMAAAVDAGDALITRIADALKNI